LKLDERVELDSETTGSSFQKIDSKALAMIVKKQCDGGAVQLYGPYINIETGENETGTVMVLISEREGMFLGSPTIRYVRRSSP
jgi:hypothetical protein